MNRQKVLSVVENICSTGCVSVNAIISTLKADKKIEGIEDFSDAEINELKNELISIMSVYENQTSDNHKT